MKSIENFRKELRSGKKMIGGSITLNDIMTSELIAHYMDFLWVDMEHGALSLDVVEGHILMAKKNGKPALVRVPNLDMGWIKMVLDGGAHGIIVPQIYTVDEVRQAVAYARYAPVGKRGFGPRLPNAYGQMGTAAQYTEWANQNIYLAVQLETKEAYEQLDRILEIDGYDAICIGPADLSISLGYGGDISCEPMREILSKAVGTIKRAGKDIGFGMAVDLAYAKIVLEMGVDWLQVGSDFDYVALMADSIKQRLGSA